MLIKNERIVLRDLIPSDIEDIIYWNTVETEWQQWDAPWEFEEEDTFDWDAYREEKLVQIQQGIQEDKLRHRLEVCINDEQQTHIGSISSYFINEEYKIVEEGSCIAISMVLFDRTLRGKGYGKTTFQFYMEYLRKHGFKEFYTQTWSGNTPMITVAKQLGFQECNRYKNLRQVKGSSYDGLTFVLTLE